MKTEDNKVKGYKGFNADMTCREFQYEVGKTYQMEGAVKVCKKGFHFCENPLDVLSYYAPSHSRYCEVEGSGAIGRDNDDSKVACSKLKVGVEIGLAGLIHAGVELILDKVDWANKKESNTVYRSASTNTNERSAATNTGDRSASTNTGYRSAATNTGYRSASTNTNERSTATNTGNCSASTNTGYCSAATNTGDCSAATNTGNRSAATNTGNYSASTNTGCSSAATNTGCSSAATVKGKDSIAIVTGYESKAKGDVGCWIVLTERDNQWHILDVKAFKVDGEIIKADTFYKLVNGKAEEEKE